MENQDIHHSIDVLGEAFHAFKHTHEERLAQLEKKNAADPLTDIKLERLQERLSQLETTAKRPGSALEIEEKSSDLVAYARKGIKGYQTKALTSEPDAHGGFLIPHPAFDRIQGILKSYSPLRGLARITEVSTDALELLLDQGHADIGWVAETADRPETATPELQKLRIPVHQVYAKPRASQKLLDDASIDLESWLVSKIADRIAEAENHAFVNGDGTHKPRGFMTYPTVAVGQGRWGTFEEIKTGHDGLLDHPDVLIQTSLSLKPHYLKNAVWLMSRSAIASVRLLKDEHGQYLWQPGLIAGAASTLLGHPIVICDDMPPLVRGTASKSLALGNWHEGYQIVDRANITLLRDPYSAKPYVEFYVTKRVGGDVINFEAIKLINCAEA